MTDAREIIATAHPADIIAQAIRKFSRTEGAGRVGEIAVSDLTAAGYRILGPDDVDPVTVEKAARLVEEGKEVSDPLDNYQSTIMVEWPSDDEAAAAIRALGRKA